MTTKPQVPYATFRTTEGRLRIITMAPGVHPDLAVIGRMLGPDVVCTLRRFLMHEYWGWRRLPEGAKPD
jgi:hypothetical protein